jgi:hypothetical protein
VVKRTKRLGKEEPLLGTGRKRVLVVLFIPSAALGEFCRKLGREAHQGEVGLIVGEEYFAIRDFSEGGTT